jgi:hypothetical protein
MTKYRVKLTMPAMAETTIEVEADNQEAAIVAGYDHAYAATPRTATLLSVSASSAMLESCEALSEAVVSQAQDVQQPPSPHATSTYTVRRFATPECLEQGRVKCSFDATEFQAAVDFATGLANTRDDYARRVVDRFGNKVFEVTNAYGGHMVVAYTSEGAYKTRKYVPWKGWLASAKLAKQEALSLLDAGRVFAVGVLDATQDPLSPTSLLTVTRKSQ